jgi:hypothetical protein
VIPAAWIRLGTAATISGIASRSRAQREYIPRLIMRVCRPPARRKC